MSFLFFDGCDPCGVSKDVSAAPGNSAPTCDGDGDVNLNGVSDAPSFVSVSVIPVSDPVSGPEVCGDVNWNDGMDDDSSIVVSVLPVTGVVGAGWLMGDLCVFEDFWNPSDGLGRVIAHRENGCPSK